MKALTITMLLVMVAAQSKSQTLSTFADTANYLMGIEHKKSEYIGKPFSTLYDSLKIKPLLVGPDYGYTNPNGEENFARELRFNFNYEQEFEKKHILMIIYNAPPAYNVIYPMFYPKETRASVADIVSIYRPLIIKDVIVKNYYEEPDWMPAIKENTPIETNAAIIEQQKNIIRNLDKYVNKPFSLLWNDLPIKPKTVHGSACALDGSRECTTTFFYASPDSLSITYFTVPWAAENGTWGIPKTETQKYQLSTIRDFTEPQEYNIYANRIMTAYIWVSPVRLYQDVGIDPVSATTEPPAEDQ